MLINPELLPLLTDRVLTAEAIDKLQSAAKEYITQKMGQPGADLEALVDHSFITQFGLQDFQAPIAEQYIRQKMHEPDANLEALVDHSFIAQFDLQDLQALIAEKYIEQQKRVLCVKIDSECHKGVFDDGFRALLSEGEHRLTAQAHFCHNLQHVQFQSLPGCFIKACADNPELLPLLTDRVLTAEAIDKLQSAAKEYITQKMHEPEADLKALVDHDFTKRFDLSNVQKEIAAQFLSQQMCKPEADLEALVDHYFIKRFGLQALPIAEKYIRQKMHEPDADLEALVDHSFIERFGLQALPIAEQYIRQKMHEPDADLKALVGHPFIERFGLQDLQVKIHQYQAALAAIQGMEVVGAGGDQRADLDNLLSKAENLRELMEECSQRDVSISEVVKTACRKEMINIMLSIQDIVYVNKDIDSLIRFKEVCGECGFNDLEGACDQFLCRERSSSQDENRAPSPDSVIGVDSTTPSSGYKKSQAGEQTQRRASSRGGMLTAQCGYGGQRFASVSTPTIFQHVQGADRQEEQSQRKLVQQLKVLGF